MSTRPQSLISVVMPTYNRSALLDRAIESIYQQNYRPIELLIVDDGSTDETESLVFRWMEKTSGNGLAIRYLRQNHAGAPAARNLGASEARGEYLHFFDSDDVMLPENLSAKAMAMETSGAAFVACDCAMFTDREDDWFHVWRFSQVEHTPAAHVRFVALNTSAPLFRREALEQVGPWDLQLNRWQDYEFCFRVMASGLKGLWLDRVLVLARHSPDSLSKTTMSDLHRSCRHACRQIDRYARRRGLMDQRMREAMGYRMAKLYRLLMEEGQRRTAEGYYRRARRLLGGGGRAVCWAYKLSSRLVGPQFAGRLPVLRKL